MQNPRPTPPPGSEAQSQIREQILATVADLPTSDVTLNDRVAAFEQAHDILKTRLAGAEEQSTWQ